VKYHNPIIAAGVATRSSKNTDSIQELRNEIREYICASFMQLRRSDDIADTDDLMETGILDSLAFTEIISEIEHRYGIAMRAIDVTQENFGSISAIADYVQRARTI